MKIRKWRRNSHLNHTCNHVLPFPKYTNQNQDKHRSSKFINQQKHNPMHRSNPTSISISISSSSIFNSLRSGSFASRSFNSSTRVSSLKLAAGAGRRRLLGTCSCRNLTWKRQSTIKHDKIHKSLVATRQWAMCFFKILNFDSNHDLSMKQLNIAGKNHHRCCLITLPIILCLSTIPR